MSWLDELGIKHFDDGGYSNEGGNYQSPTYSSEAGPAASYGDSGATSYGIADSGPVNTYNVGSSGGDVVRQALYGNAGYGETSTPYSGDAVRQALYGNTGYGEAMPSGEAPTSAVNPYAYTPWTAGDQRVNTLLGLQREMNDRAWRSGSGELIRDRFGAPVLDRAGSDLVASKQVRWDDRTNSPTYHQWVPGAEMSNGVPGYTDAKGNWVYGTSRTGLSYDQLKQLQAEGKGGMDLTDNQTVDHALATMEADKYLTKYIAPGIQALAGAQLGPAFTIAKLAGNVLSGKTSPGDAIVNTALGMAGQKLGIPPGLLQSAVNMNVRDAAAQYGTSQVIGEGVKALSQQTGVPAPLVSQMLMDNGVGKSVSEAFSSVARSLLPDTSVNTTGRISGGINSLLGTPRAPGNETINYNPAGGYRSAPPLTVPTSESTTTDPGIRAQSSAAGGQDSLANLLTTLSRG